MTILRGGPLGKITQCLSHTYSFQFVFMVSYAIAEACGKQFWLEEGRFYDFNKLPLNKGDLFTLNNILLVKNGDDILFGTPYLDKEYTINVEVLRHVAGSKVRVYKMRPKKKTRKTFGSKPKFTRVLIKSVIKNTQTVAV